MAKTSGYKLTPKQKEDLAWDLVAGVKTKVLMEKYKVSATTIKYYRNPLVHKARFKRFYSRHRDEENARTRAYYAKHRKVIRKKRNKG